MQSLEKLQQKGYNMFEEQTQELDEVAVKFSTPKARSFIDEAVMRKGLKSKFFHEFKTQHKASIASQLKVIKEALGPDNLDVVKVCKEYLYTANLQVKKKKGLMPPLAVKKPSL
jgi:hypothetical protein